ncbi:acyl-CoA N-acyltransferase [Lophiotrema nucula]|uniref:Acyl-CoA N-acyltransferase n=1 Tax=Lophiotrema nucula TaxID=690887 RepID=A0A6A5ZPG9_9PLEO|nr:acyl-CoA N-acyltransferase [Lophiotrema nucula]
MTSLPVSSSTAVEIRLATPSDIPHIMKIHKEAYQTFRDHGMAMPDFEPSPGDFLSSLNDEKLWVAEENSSCAGFIQADAFCNGDSDFYTAYIRQVSVSTAHARKGVGKQLIEFVEGWARELELQGIDLTTYKDIPWNAPYYERLGYSTLGREELCKDNASDVHDELKSESEHELCLSWPRVAMRKCFDCGMSCVAQ